MKEFKYIIKDEIGIHARPAGLIVSAAKEFSSKITIEANGKSADATRLMAIMGLGVKTGAEVVVKAVGEDEEKAIAKMQECIEGNL